MDESPPLDAATEAAVLDAARGLLADRWVATSPSLRKVAERAGVDVERLYDRWPSTVRLVVEAIGGGAAIEDVPDLGDTRLELSIALQALIGARSDRPAAERSLLLQALSSGLGDDAMAVVRDHGERPWRDRVLAVLRRAVARGDLPPDADLEVIVDLWAGAIAYRRAFRSEALDASFVTVLLDLALAGGVPLQPNWLPEPRETMPEPLWDALAWLSEVAMGRIVRVADGLPAGALALAPEHRIEFGGHRLTVTAGVGRDFMPIWTENSTRMSGGVTVEAEGGGSVPPFVRANRMVVLHGDEAWVAPLEEVSPHVRGSRQFAAPSRTGPLWEPGATVDIYVQLAGPGRFARLVRVPGIRIGQTA